MRQKAKKVGRPRGKPTKVIAFRVRIECVSEVKKEAKKLIKSIESRYV